MLNAIDTPDSLINQRIRDLGMDDYVSIIGKRSNPYPYIKKADYFCLLSNFEGYGMVLEEAKILGKPIIITDTAAREAVEKYENSLILENDEDKIYEGLRSVIKTNKINDKDFENKPYDNSKIIENLIKLIGE